jgi:hypothetical protein
MRRDHRPLLITEPKIVRHESSPPQELESRRGFQFNWVQALRGRLAAEQSAITSLLEEIKKCALNGTHKRSAPLCDHTARGPSFGRVR